MATPEQSPAGARDALLRAAQVELAEHGNAAIGLRAVARRAGVSHAAPKYFFENRAGLLTAVATTGFQELTERLRAARLNERHEHEEDAADGRLAAAGRIYFDFGLDEPAMFDLMFRSSDLHPDDPVLVQAKSEALGELTAVVGGADATEALELTLANWAFAHGLVTLAREQALGSAGQPGRTPREVAHRLFDVFASQGESR